MKFGMDVEEVALFFLSKVWFLKLTRVGHLEEIGIDEKLKLK